MGTISWEIIWAVTALPKWVAAWWAQLHTMAIAGLMGWSYCDTAAFPRACAALHVQLAQWLSCLSKWRPVWLALAAQEERKRLGELRKRIKAQEEAQKAAEEGGADGAQVSGREVGGWVSGRAVGGRGVRWGAVSL